MTLRNFILGLDIIRAHYDDPDGYHLGAEHDTIYVYPTDTPLNSEEAKAVCELGFFQEDAEVPDDKDFGPEYYDPEEGWAHYA